MNIAERKKQLEEANDFINSGKKTGVNRKADRKPVRAKDNDQQSNEKKYLNCYLPTVLIRKIRIEAARITETGHPSHLVQRILEDYFNEQEN
jgi:hypothetical protein